MTEIACPICGKPSLEPLGNPNPSQSIASDLRILNEPLQKAMCSECGAILRPEEPLNFDFCSDDYDLYAHEPGQGPESSRQSAYADWLSTSLEVPGSLFEAGAGNGSLFLALREKWPLTRMRGVEPAPAAARAARRAGFAVARSILQDNGTPQDVCDVALSVNVIEHTPDPLRFIQSLATHGRRTVVVCPNGAVPNNELLFADHRQSLTPAHLVHLFGRAGLRVEKQVAAPLTLGEFFMTVGVDGTDGSNARFAFRSRTAIEHYLDQWAKLDDVLLERLGNAGEVMCFGAGEAAGLLRAYAPRTWSRVTACVMDNPTVSHFAGLPVLNTGEARPGKWLLAVRPASQAAVTERLHRFHTPVVRWDDLISS